jgi:antitoxin component YwqK of YwqJK toxin-antitoxin module
VIRIQADELEIDDYVYLYQGKPFSGVAYDNRPDGRLWSEQTLYAGVPDGPTRVWHENGALKLEKYFKLGRLHGPLKEWNADGTPLSEAVYELGICIERRTWTGGAVTEYRIDPTSVEFRKLEAARKNEAARVERFSGPAGS